MKQRQREQVQRGCVVGTVVLLAWLCRVLPLEGMPSGLQEACGILRSLLYLSLFAGWGISLYNRTVHPQVRRLLLNVDLLMLFWILVRTLRFQLNTPPEIDRMLGYLYYAPMLGIPVLCVQLVLTVDRSERYRLSAWARMLWLPSAVLLELVLTTHAAVEKAPRTFDAEAHHALARRAAAESVVLLQNEGGLLPLKVGERVAVVGDFAQTPRYQGAGSSAVNSIKVDSVLGQLAESGLQSVGFAPGFDRQGRPDDARKAEAVALARKADTVLLFLGLDEIKESEGIDRSDMKLAVNQLDLLEAIGQVNSNVVVVLSAGASLETPWLKNCRALVYGALGGQAGAGAMLDVLTGKVCPSGKLAETWANAYHETPARAHFGGEGRTVEYRESLYVGYRYHQTAGIPSAFPFGYGLSYTSCVFRDLKEGTAGVTLTVTNTGSCAGAEIVQLYVAKQDAKIFRPAQELKGFARVFLNPGESREVTIPLDDKAFRYWNVKTDRWEVEGGSYQLRVGASSADIRLTEEVSVKGTNAPDPYEGLDLLHYVSGQITYVTDAEFEALLGHPIPEDVVRIDRNMTLGEMDHGRSPLGWVAQKVLRCRLDSSFAKGTPDLNTVFQYNMPLRALAKMTNGMVSMGMVDGLVWELKGFWLVGILRVIYEFVKNLILNSQMENRLKNS